MNRTTSFQVVVLALLILVAAFSRLIPHWPNFTALGAMALFGAAHFRHKALAILAPFIALYLSDLVINNVIYGSYYDSFVWQISPFIYLGFGLIVLIGYLLRGRIQLGTVMGASIGASVVFFLVSNLGSWIASPMYTKDLAGLLLAYEAGIPFFWNTLAGDLVYSGILFGGYAWLSQRLPQLQAVPTTDTPNVLDEQPYA